ncbi:MAG: hypothetical protein ACE5HJ_07395 [Thermoplasmata archaeon]
MAGEEVTLERILQVYREESQKKALTPLERDFWERVQKYVASLEDDLSKESSHDPNSAKAALLRDELRKVLKRRDQIYQYRERKMLLLASSAASGASVDTTPLTPEEEESFEAMLEVLERGRLRALAMEVEESRKGQGEAEEVEEKEEAPKEAAPDQVLVRVLEDIPPFLGLDVTYRLKKEDVVTLPEEVAQVLISKGKAERIRPKL